MYFAWRQRHPSDAYRIVPVKLGLNIYLSYGLTEMSSQVATGKVIAADKPCAKVLPYRQLKISPEGEILVKGEVLFKGYITGTRLPIADKRKQLLVSHR